MKFLNTTNFAWVDERNTVDFQWNFDTIYTPSPITLTVVNPGAETGDTTGWTNAVGSLAVRSASPAPYAGSYYFDGGDNAETKAYQDIDLLSDGLSAYVIDAGDFHLLVEWYQASYEVSDQAQVYVEYYTSGMSLISSASIGLGAVSPALTWGYRYMRSQVPATARYVRMYLHIYRVTGTHNNGSIDSVSAKAIRNMYHLGVTNRDADTGDTTGWTNELGGVAAKSSANYTAGYCFSGGNYAETKSYQDLNLVSLGASTDLIDDEKYDITVEWHQSGYSGDNDSAEVIIYFLNSSSEIIGYYYPGLIEYDSGWHYRTYKIPVPGQARYVRLKMHMFRTGGTENSGYVDEIHATLSTNIKYGSGAAQVIADGIVTGAGIKTALANAQVVADGVVTGTGIKTALASAQVVADGVVTADGCRHGFGSPQVVADGILTGTGLKTALADAQIIADGIVTGTGLKTALASAQVSAYGVVTGTGIKTALVSAQVVADGVVTAFGYANVFGSAQMSANGVVAGVGLKTALVSAQVSADGVVTGTGLKTALASAQLSADGILTGSGFKTGLVSAQVDSYGVVTADGLRHGFGSPQVVADGILTGTGLKTALVSAQMVADAALVSTGLKVGFGDAVIGGAAVISGGVFKTALGSAQVSAKVSFDSYGFINIIIEVWDGVSLVTRTLTANSGVLRSFSEYSEIVRDWIATSEVHRTADVDSIVTRTWTIITKLRRR